VTRIWTELRKLLHKNSNKNKSSRITWAGHIAGMVEGSETTQFGRKREVALS
jgi:hypothetical protein